MKSVVVLLVALCFLSHYSFSQDEPESRDIIIVGYQIGGYSLLGIEVEARMTNLLGVNFGGGFLGYTGGLKFHTGPNKNSPAINISYKDGGMGRVQVFAAEFAARIPFSYNDNTGLFIQGGLTKVLYMDDELSYDLFKKSKAPPYMLSFGIGLCW